MLQIDKIQKDPLSVMTPAMKQSVEKTWAKAKAKKIDRILLLYFTTDGDNYVFNISIPALLSIHLSSTR